eukprot:4869483-Prymnesium_polylepis.3
MAFRTLHAIIRRLEVRCRAVPAALAQHWHGCSRLAVRAALARFARRRAVRVLVRAWFARHARLRPLPLVVRPHTAEVGRCAPHGAEGALVASDAIA